MSEICSTDYEYLNEKFKRTRNRKEWEAENKKRGLTAWGNIKCDWRGTDVAYIAKYLSADTAELLFLGTSYLLNNYSTGQINEGVERQHLFIVFKDVPEQALLGLDDINLYFSKPGRNGGCQYMRLFGNSYKWINEYGQKCAALGWLGMFNLRHQIIPDFVNDTWHRLGEDDYDE